MLGPHVVVCLIGLVAWSVGDEASSKPAYVLLGTLGALKSVTSSSVIEGSDGPFGRRSCRDARSARGLLIPVGRKWTSSVRGTSPRARWAWAGSPGSKIICC